MKLKEILAKLTGVKNEETQEVVVPTAEELTSLATSLSEKEAELTTLATALTEKETSLVTKEGELTVKETSLTEKEIAVATKETNLEEEISKAALKLSVQGTTPVKAEAEVSDVVKMYEEAKTPAEKQNIFNKHSEELKKAKISK